jgi:DNA-binding transcriptional regulator YiaG
MTTTTMTDWKPGMDLPYTLSFGDGRLLAIALNASWLKADRSGKPLLLPPAVRALDRLRAILATPQAITPGFIVSLREGMGLTQQEFGQKLGVSKMTVSRWECGLMRPNRSRTAAILKLQTRAKHAGVQIDGEKQPSRYSVWNLNKK